MAHVGGEFAANHHLFDEDIDSFRCPFLTTTAFAKHSNRAPNRRDMPVPRIRTEVAHGPARRLVPSLGVLAEISERGGGSAGRFQTEK